MAFFHGSTNSLEPQAIVARHNSNCLPINSFMNPRGCFSSGYKDSHGGRSRGRADRFTNSNLRWSIQCQVCLKDGHSVATCYYRFDQNYQPPPMSPYNNVYFPPPHHNTTSPSKATAQMANIVGTP